MERLLIIDDDVELCALVRENIESEGFEVEAVHEPEQGLTKVRSGIYSLLILDVMMPGMSGFDVLRKIRAMPSTLPVLLLTARGDEVDRIVGLELGADDYLAKPFHPRELVARIRAILRRTHTPATEATPERQMGMLQVGDVELDRGTRSVMRGKRALELTALEFDILRHLLENAGRVVSRDQLAEAVMGKTLSPFDRSIDMHISKIRRKLGERPGRQLIKTIRNAGYIFVLASARG
ncbi:MAG: response regulator transcription factor [Candidatus Koribacter versatilis]|uniref:Response regulator transcription factor n=1 Tax=Candidatus Korobacter versatilis TaxID=658062 RepID=A0A932A9N3_9BACT|nr:response regulator transcription factor [Candidatus Koribacter versatilis]